MTARYDWTAGEVAVVGLGRSGSAAARLLRKLGARVYASDAGGEAAEQAAAALRAEGVEAEAGGHDLGRLAAARAVVASPGVPPDAPPLAAARAAGVRIISEVEVALAALPGLRYIGVTGTNGKTTVTALAAHLLRTVGVDAEAAGNIGTPLSDLALRERVPAWVVLELSSFQLHDTPSVAPAVGVLTNLSPDHLDRYATVADYYADKALLFRHATRASHWVVNADDAEVMAMVRNVAGQQHRFAVSGQFADAFLGGKGKQYLIVHDETLLSRHELPLLGEHNVANALAALLAVLAAVPALGSLDGHQRLAAALRTFRPPAHRLEPVGEPGGVLWVNDSKATNVASARVAIESMTRPTILLLGGRHKGEPYTALLDAIARHCRLVLAYGEAAERIEGDLRARAPVERVTGGFAEVVARARAVARPGDAILLAPACSSYDMFANYEERGRAFAALAAQAAASGSGGR